MDGHTHPGEMTSEVRREDGRLNGLLGIVIVASLGLIILRGQGLIGGGGDPKAAAVLFDSSSSYTQAAERAAEQDLPVFVFATADWCGPCQSFKGRVLADESVQGELRGSSVPYLLDVTTSPVADAQDAQLAAELRIGEIPAFYLIDDGEVVARGSGAISKANFLNWLEAGTEAAQSE